MKTPKRKRTHADKQRLMTQILAIVMAALMLLGVIAAIIPYFALPMYALDATASDSTEITESDQPSDDTPPVQNPAADDLLLRIGLMFGSGVTPSFAVQASAGFIFHTVDADNTAEMLFSTGETVIAVCRDSNLAINEKGYYIPSTQNVVIGGYHLELPATYADAAALKNGVDTVNRKLQEAGLSSSLIYAFPTYRNGVRCVRIGDFGSGDSALSKASAIALAVGETPVPVYPEPDALTVLSPSSNLILFEYSEQSKTLGITAAADADGNPQLLVTPAKNGYEGTFLMKRYQDGISVTNLISLEQYVAGVLPYEISNTWSYECQKAFAVIIRSYTLANRGKHTSYGIDLCNGTDCQVYMGTGRQNDAVLRAVEETRGMVIAYDDKICSTIYSAVTGGCTVNIEQIWNGHAYPYLRAVDTPWEDYASHPNGLWYTEVSAHDLYEYLAFTKGYKQLKSDIADVRITALAENSTYVYQLEIIDTSGNILSLRGTDVIRTGLSRYLKSANFVVAHHGQIPILDKVYTVRTEEGTQPLTVIEEDGQKTTQILTADGIISQDVSNGLSVLTENGVTNVEENGNYDIPQDALDLVMTPDNTNFIFIGKGWGHGGGISQWGAKNMAENGAFWDEIIHAYFTNVEILHYQMLLQ